MRKLILKMSVSLDGFVGGPNGEIDWLLRGLDDITTSWIRSAGPVRISWVAAHFTIWLPTGLTPTISWRRR
jgi:hypothetical protein